MLPRALARRSAFASRLGLASAWALWLSLIALCFRSARLASRAFAIRTLSRPVRTLKTAQVPRSDHDRGRNFQVFHLPFGPSARPSTPFLPSGLFLTSFQDQALDRLVSSSSMRYRTSTDDLSTLSSSRGLTSLRCGNSILQGGFTLRCLQRLSRPHFASQLCRWHDNCCTRGASIPVLSY